MLSYVTNIVMGRIYSANIAGSKGNICRIQDLCVTKRFITELTAFPCFWILWANQLIVCAGNFGISLYVHSIEPVE